MRRFRPALATLVLWLCAFVAHADGFRASYTPEAQPASAPQRSCNGCSCSGGNTPGFQGASVADPIWTKDGSLHLSYMDLSIGAVMPIHVVRSYDSQSAYDSAVGYGWAFFHDQRLFEYPDGSIIIRSGCGRRDKFVFSGGAYVTPQGGSQGQLTEKTDGTYEFRYRDGNRDLYDASGRLTARVARSGARQDFLYDARGKLPLVGTSPRAVDPTAPMVVAYQPRLTRIQERGADGALTGYFIDFQYNDVTGRVTKAIASDGREISYGHDVAGTATRGNLVSISGLDDYAQTFAYADPNDAHNITTITDGTGAQSVVNTFDAQDRVTKQVEGGSTFVLAYPSLGVTTITETVTSSTGSTLQTRVSRREYSIDGYLTKHVDPDGHELRYTYDANNQLARTELWQKTGATLALLKATDTAYTATGQKLSETTTLDDGEVITGTWTYDNGWVASEQTVSSASAQLFRTEYTFLRDAGGIPRAVASVRQRKDDGSFAVTAYTYCSEVEAGAGGSTCPDISLVKSIDGPRSDVNDVVSFSYYGDTDTAGCGAPAGNCFHRGDLRAFTNALGHATQYLRYDASGRPVQIRDANGVVAEAVYHPRGWLQQSIVRGADGSVTTDDAITQYQMDARGNLTQLTTADGNTVTMTYDTRDRLSKIRDQAGNEVRYTLDSAGNRSKEEAYTSGNTQRRVQSFAYDKWSRLIQLTGSTGGQVSNLTYDAAGRLAKTVDPNLVEVVHVYDDLDRLVRTVSDAKVGGINATSQFRYNAAGNLREVVDPKNLSTTYTYDALGRLLQLVSPDTGTTVYTYDNAGNRLTQTDARGTTTTYTYDALDRIATVAYPTAAENVAYTYDVASPVCQTGETFTVGRLTRITDQSGSTDYCYDRFGQVVRKVQTTVAQAFTVRYAYTLGGALRATTYPDGTVVDNARDTQSRVQEIGVALAGGARQVLLNAATYYPAGPSAGWTFGNGRTMARVFDKDYRASTIRDAGTNGIDIGLRYDNAGYLTQLTNAALATTPRMRYTYDALGRLTKRSDSASAPLETYTYDATGNRTSLALGTAAAQAYGYAANNHRLTAVDGVGRVYDAAGNLTSIGGTAREYVYNDAGRMSAAKQSGTLRATYEYNGLGEQVRRATTVSTVFVYDEAGHLLGQYGATGTPIQQYVWMDDQPVGVISGASLHYVETDHLGTPRVVVDATRQKAIWTLDLASEPFGNTVPNSDPDGDAIAFAFDLRLPGQRYDSASGINYNYFRNYEPATGRYVESDPIGLRAGASTYSYVYGKPLLLQDPFGLWAGIDDAIFAGGGALVGLAGQGISDFISGDLSGWEKYTAAALGGALGGETLLYTGNPFLAGAVGGASTNALAQGLEIATGKRACFNWTTLAVDTGVGTLTGIVGSPGKFIAGYGGRNGLSAVTKSSITKLKNGTISRIRGRTVAKMAVTNIIDNFPGAGAGGVAAVPSGKYLDNSSECGCN